MVITHLAEIAVPVKRPGCAGMRSAPVVPGEAGNATALYFAPQAMSDDHAVPFDQWLVVVHGSGWVSIGDDSAPVRAGDAVLLRRETFHRLWTGDEAMDALALAFQPTRGHELVRVPDRAALARNAADRFVLIAQAAVVERGRCSVALSGGSTPRDLYTLLATPEYAARVDWSRVHLFWGDERDVPRDDPASNYRMVDESLLSHVPLPPENVHRILTERGPANAASAYVQVVKDFFQPEEGTLPRFDLMLLGLGENGHTASLFPHTEVLHNRTDWVAAEYIAEVKMNRITLTEPVINASANILFLVAGADKASTLRAVLRGDYRPEDLPAQLIQPRDGSLVWLLDRAAAAQL